MRHEAHEEVSLRGPQARVLVPDEVVEREQRVPRPRDELGDGGPGGVRAAVSEPSPRAVEGLPGNFRARLVYDGSRERSDLARRRVSDAVAAYRDAWLRREALARGSFDAVVCTVSFEYLTQPHKIVAEAKRVLKPGGRLVQVDAGPDHLRELRKRVVLAVYGLLAGMAALAGCAVLVVQSRTEAAGIDKAVANQAAQIRTEIQGMARAGAPVVEVHERKCVIGQALFDGEGHCTAVLRAIPRGEVVTYGELAALAKLGLERMKAEKLF